MNSVKWSNSYSNNNDDDANNKNNNDDNNENGEKQNKMLKTMIETTTDNKQQPAGCTGQPRYGVTPRALLQCQQGLLHEASSETAAMKLWCCGSGDKGNSCGCSHNSTARWG